MNRFVGIIGLVVLAFGIGAGLFAASFDNLLVLSHIAVGVLASAFWFVTVGLRNSSEIKAALSGRTARFGVMAVIYSVVALGVLVVLNILVTRHNKKWDLTEQGAYSLASQSENVIKSLKKPLRIVGFKGQQLQDGSDAKELLERYAEANSALVKIELIDPAVRPDAIDKYGMKAGNLLYLEYGEGDKKGVNRLNDINEQVVTNAIIKLTRGESKKIYYVIGHEEPSLQQGAKFFADAVGDENLTMTEIYLPQRPTVPEDAAAVVLVAPKKALAPGEKETLIKYAEAGGRLLLLTDPRGSSEIREIADHFGIEVGDNLIIDQVQRPYAAPALGGLLMVRDYPRHDIVKGLSSAQITLFNIASSVRSKGAPKDGSTVTEFAKSSPTSWAESNLADVFDREEPSAKLEPGSGDIPGPISIAAAYEKKLIDPSKSPEKFEEGETKPDDKSADEAKFDKLARVVVFGDSDWILSSNLQAASSNRDLILNAVNWLVGETGGISIRPRTLKTSGTQLLPKETVISILVSSLILPELLLLLGLFIWWRRRTSYRTA